MHGGIFGAVLAGALFLVTLQSCTDTVMNPTQVATTVGLVYRGNGLFRNDTAVLDSASGNPVHIIFVSLSSQVKGNGTYESPYTTLAPAMSTAKAGDIVFVYRGVDPGLGDFHVPDGVRLYGVVTMPYSGSEALTTVTGLATLGNNCEIAGFLFTNHSGNGIFASEISNVNIHDNRFVNTRRQAVFLYDVAGNIVVHDNQIYATTDSTSPGIFIQNEKVALNAWVYLNSVEDPSGDGIKILTEGTGVTVATVDSNTVLRSNGSGIKFFSLNSANTTATISNNVIGRNKIGDVSIVQDGAIRFGTFNNIIGKVTVVKNRIYNCASNGVFIGSENQAHTQVNVLDNDISECIGNGIFVGAQQTSLQKALISNNVVRHVHINTKSVGFPTGHGIFFGSLYSGREEGTIVFNRCYENDKNGVFAACFNSGTMTTTISDNLLSNNGANGIEMNSGLNIPPPGPDQVAPPLPLPGVNSAKHRVYNNVIAGNKGGGDVGQEGGGIMNLVFNGAALETILENNHVNNNGSADGAYAGLGLLVFDNSTANFSIRKNTFALNPASPAVNIRTFGAIPPNAPDPTKLPTLCLELSDNVSDTGFLLTKDDKTKFTATIQNNTGPVLIPFALDSDPGCSPPRLAAGSR